MLRIEKRQDRFVSPQTMWKYRRQQHVRLRSSPSAGTRATTALEMPRTECVSSVLTTKYLHSDIAHSSPSLIPLCGCPAEVRTRRHHRKPCIYRPELCIWVLNFSHSDNVRFI